MKSKIQLRQTLWRTHIHPQAFKHRCAHQTLIHGGSQHGRQGRFHAIGVASRNGAPSRLKESAFIKCDGAEGEKGVSSIAR